MKAVYDESEEDTTDSFSSWHSSDDIDKSEESFDEEEMMAYEAERNRRLEAGHNRQKLSAVVKELLVVSVVVGKLVSALVGNSLLIR